MGGRNSRETMVGPQAPWRSLAVQAALGFLAGYVVLHPVSMVIFQWLDPRMAAAMHGQMTGGLFAPIAKSFTREHLAMGFVFGFVAAVVTTLYGYHRLAITFQRDRLAEELARNEELRAELARQNEDLANLELANRRTTQYIAHDFKTSLNCIGGFSTQLLQTPELQLRPEVTHALTCIRRQAHRVMGAVVDLLQVARVRERGAPRVEPIVVAEALCEALGDFSLPDEARQVVLGHEHARCPPVLANRSLLRRVLCNLISNAIRHNRLGTRVWLDAHADESGGEAVFTCRDDGEGIPPEVLPRLFCEFAAAEMAADGSTGLGLAFCKAAVQSQGGRIWCENLPQGCQFCFTLPLTKEHVNESSASSV